MEIEEVIGRLMALSGRIGSIEERVDFIEDDIPEAELSTNNAMVSVDDDFAFKVTAVEEKDSNGDSYDPKRYTVTVMNGTAQVYGGIAWSPCLEGHTTIDLDSVEEFSYIMIRYDAYDPDSFIEIGDWELQADLLLSPAGEPEAPETLRYVIAQISGEYAGNVNQMHEGNIVMPAVSNIVDLQGLS